MGARRVFLLSLALSLGACSVSRRVDVIPYLPPTETATLDELVARINQWHEVHSLVLRVDLQFETVIQAAEGEGRQYRTAQGRLLLSRPENVRLNIEAPILSANIAEMASNGKRFQLLIYPPDYRALIEGSNDRSYREETEKLNEDPELEKAGPLVNIRPQHFADAFLLAKERIGSPGTAAFLEEQRVVEPDTRPGSNEDSQVQKSYYVVTAVHIGEDAPRAKYWFDRMDELTLTRQQVYDRDGRLVANIHYSSYLPPRGDAGVRIASRVHIERPYDEYGLILNVKPDGILINRDLPETAFVVTAPEEWGDNLRHIDLDARDRVSHESTALSHPLSTSSQRDPL